MLDALEYPNPDPDGADGDTDDERANHPAPVLPDVIMPDRPEREYEAGQKPAAEHHRREGFWCASPGVGHPKRTANSPEISAQVSSTRPSRRCTW